MIESVIRNADPNVSYSSVWASRGKVRRAEPIAALYEQNRVHHVGSFPKLEDQMCVMTCDFSAAEMGFSPDRCDALVWALTELSESASTTTRGLFTSVSLSGAPSAPDWYSSQRYVR
jgi:phage terminase large subunit-like protein